ncbi:MAG: hypothetical protein JST89_22490 [Cyanobacteria bacterium SZAS-4]|nr:hypothetical protein [Cyanobacteria bacterium SZAS-4]
MESTAKCSCAKENLAAYEVWRQDDNGNQVMIEKACCEAEALDRVRLFTERGHKQLYWAQAVSNSR